MKSIINSKFFLITGIILLAAMTRFIPYIISAKPDSILWNFNPIMALALFGGSLFNEKKFAFIVPFTALLISDLFIGLHETMWAVYLSFGIGILIGFWLNNKVSTGKVILASLSSSIIFYIITNFAYWLMFKPLTSEFLIQSYIDAIPFFRNALLGDLVYCGVFFGGFSLAERYLPILEKVRSR
jgi:hypothetical protein